MAGFKYEVFGQVQGVFFRKYTVAEAQRLGLVGYVRNTERGTVEGEAQGPPNELAAFKDFLTKRGSPQSRIDRCNFTNEFSEERRDYEGFCQK